MKHQVVKVVPSSLPSVGAALVQAAGLHKYKPEASSEEYAHLVKHNVVRRRDGRTSTTRRG